MSTFPPSRVRWIQEFLRTYDGPDPSGAIRNIRRRRGQHAPDPGGSASQAIKGGRRLAEGEGKWPYGRGKRGRFIRQPTIPEVSDRSHIFADGVLPADPLSAEQEQALDLVNYEEWRLLTLRNPTQAARAVARWAVGSSSMKDSRGNRILQFSDLMVEGDESEVDAVDRVTGGSDYGLGSDAHLDRLDGLRSFEDWLQQQSDQVQEFVELLAASKQTEVAEAYGVVTRTVRRWTRDLQSAIEVNAEYRAPPNMRRR
jgi:hypothetical protein